MSNLVHKAVLKVLRSFGIQKKLKIKSGLLKGLKWNVSIPDSRYIAGTYEVNLAERVKNAVEQGYRFVDIGANAGYFSLIAGKYGKASTEHLAVEPFPQNVSLLKDHLSSNEIFNVHVEPLAISDRLGEISFSNSGNLAANTYKSESSMFKGDVIKVNTTDLNTFASKHDLSEKTLIKIDVEGAELDVLKGGKTFLSHHQPTLVLATHDCHVPGVKDACLEFLRELNYSCTTLEDEKIAGQEDFLCVPTQSSNKM